jgi:4-hydroxy-tetrahydrodipicolinate reductase
VDFTIASAVRDHAWIAVESGVHVVIGSSGLAAADYEELDHLARDRGVGVIAVGNFSIMAAVLRRAAAMAAQYLDHWEIIDYASDRKSDVPSGTALELAETLTLVRTLHATVAPADLDGPVETRGAEVSGTRVHSVRLPSFVVSTEIISGGPGERLIMRHDPGLSPDPYVAGTLLAVHKAADVPGVRRGLDSLLFDEPPPSQ